MDQKINADVKVSFVSGIQKISDRTGKKIAKAISDAFVPQGTPAYLIA